jgi:hypothetical protein
MSQELSQELILAGNSRAASQKVGNNRVQSGGEFQYLIINIVGT